MFSKYRVINCEYIVKVEHVEHVYDVKPFGFLEVWHKIPLVTIKKSVGYNLSTVLQVNLHIVKCLTFW